MSNKKNKHIGLIGCGRWGGHILRDLKSLNCIVSVVAPSEKSVTNAQERNADFVVASIEVLDCSTIDGFIVASPTATHSDVIKQIAIEGKPIFTEKPLTNSLQTARELVESHGELIFVMDKWKYHSGITKLRELISSGDYGAVKRINLKRIQWKTPHKDVDPVWILMPHDISIAQYLLDQTPQALFATGQKLNSDSLSSLHATLCVGDINIIIEVAGDTVCTERSVHVVCERGSLWLPCSDSDHLLFQQDSNVFNGSPESIPFEPNMPLFDEVKTFVNYLSNPNVRVQSTATEALENVELIEQLRALALN
ncbi:MAG: Gfo/Idh/MocA family protein [Pirellulales bacterium]